MFETSNQHLIFAAFFAAGLLSGLVYEFFYFFRAAFKFGRVASAIGDILFSLFCGLIMVLTARAVCYGQIRLYSVISFILGYFSEHLSLHKHIAKIYAFVYNHLYRLIAKIKSSKAVKKIFK